MHRDHYAVSVTSYIIGCYRARPYLPLYRWTCVVIILLLITRTYDAIWKYLSAIEKSTKTNE